MAARSFAFLASAQGPIQPQGGILLHTRHDVTVRVERYAHTRVPESLADHFWADAKSQQMGGVAVAQVVKANTRESSDSISFANPAVHRFQREAGTGTSLFRPPEETC